MHIIAKPALRSFWERYADAKIPLTEWFKVTKKCQWENLAEVRQSFSHADP